MSACRSRAWWRAGWGGAVIVLFLAQTLTIGWSGPWSEALGIICLVIGAACLASGITALAKPHGDRDTD